MSRVHDALRRAEQMGVVPATEVEQRVPAAVADPGPAVLAPVERKPALVESELTLALTRSEEIPYVPAEEAHLISLDSPAEMPGEEFRSLRTRLNHLATL